MDLAQWVSSTTGGTWELYRDDRGVPVVRSEIHGAYKHPYQQAMLLAELKRLMRAAEDGSLKPYIEIKRIHLRPSVLELRLNVTGRLWRLYFVCISNQGPLRLALRFAEKLQVKDAAAAQDQDILTAWSRYKSWLQRRTG